MFDIPGFDGLLRGGITESVRGIMVFPNKYVIKMVEEVDISALKYPMPEVIRNVIVFLIILSVFNSNILCCFFLKYSKLYLRLQLLLALLNRTTG